MFIFRKRKSSKKRKSPEKYKYTITRTPNAHQTIDMVTQATRLEGGGDEPLDATEKFHYSHGSQNQQVFSSQTSRREVRRKKTRKIEKFKNACKKTTTFLFSRVGLCIVCIGYVAVGGLIFRSIEGSHEDQKMKNKSLVGDLVNTRTDTLVNEIWNMTKFEKVFHEKNYTSKLKTKLVEYQKNLTDAVKDGYKGSLSYNATKWTYPGSILYSVTIVTTIGYGHITCETDTGKIVTIFYAIFGIPMMLLCLANIGSSMANLFRFLYARVCCGYCNYVKRRNIRMKAAATLSSAAAAGQANAAAAAAALSLAALTSNNLLAHASSDEKQGHNEKFDKHADPNELIDLIDETNVIDYKKITVPISITLFVLSSYVLLGGIFFKTLEEWTVIEGVYFCFITLSTIGLGDYVPGNSINDSDTQAELKLVGCSLYLLIGLSLLVMCFNLMQEEVSLFFI